VLKGPFSRANAVESIRDLAFPWLLHKRSRSTDTDLSRRNPKPVPVRSDHIGRLDPAMFAPSSDVLTVELKFDSHANAADCIRTLARKSAVYWRPPGNGETLPNSSEDRANAVRLLRHAIEDDFLGEPGSYYFRAWANCSLDPKSHFDNTTIEAACWRLAVSQCNQRFSQYLTRRAVVEMLTGLIDRACSQRCPVDEVSIYTELAVDYRRRVVLHVFLLGPGADEGKNRHT
jgi:hypothetical protein